MNKEEMLEYLYNSNMAVSDTLVDGFINDKIIKFLPLYVLEYCVLNKEAQEAIMKLTNNELCILSQIIKYAEKERQDWVPLAASFAHFLKNAKYNELVNDINSNNVDNILIPELIFLTKNGGNFFGIKSLDDLTKYNSLRINRLKDLEKSNDPNIIFLLKYGISYDDGFNLYKRYGKDVDLLPNSLEKEFLRDIKNIIEGKGTESKIFIYLDFINNIDSRLRNMFAKIYNNYFYQFNDEKLIDTLTLGDVSIPIYDAGTDFTMSIYSYGLASDLKAPSNYKEDWLRPRVSVDYMCNSIINSLNMRTTVKHCVYGFNNFAANDLALLGANDLGTGGIYYKVNVTNPYYSDKLIADVEFRVPDELINNTRFTNNEVYRKRRRVVNGKLERITPDYIVYFKKDDNYLNDSIWVESVNAAKDFQIPIVMIDCEKCLVSNVEKIDNLFLQFESRYDDVSVIKKIIEMIYSLKSGYRVAPELLEKHLNTDKLYSYVLRIANHLEKMASLVPTIAIKGIDTFLDILDEEYEKILKSPYWVEYARKRGDLVDKPNNIIEYLNKMKKEIMENYGIVEEKKINL